MLNSLDAGSAGQSSPGGPGAGVSSSSAARIGLWALAIGFGGFLLWAGLAPLDEGVPGQGMVAIDTKRKPVQHLQGGIVKEVLVREGDQVKAGQVLVTLDNGAASTAFEAIRQRYLGERAVQGRLEAENTGASTIRFHPDLMAASSDPLIKRQMDNQVRLFASRRAALQADVQALEESILGQQGIARSYEGMVANRRSQLDLLTKEIDNIRGLVQEGYAPRNRQNELERMALESSTSITELMGNMARSAHTVAEYRQRIIQRKNEYRKEVETQLGDYTREVQADEVRFAAVRDELGRTDIKAPVDGQVMSLAVQAAGSVLQPGQKLMDIVPENEKLLLEARVAPQLIDHVRTGLLVDIRFMAFAHSPQLVVQGKVESITNDLVVEEQTGASYYLARVSVTPEGLKTLGKRQMQAGMPVDVVFKTGERSLLTYLLHPLTKRVAAAMTEE